jgi:putative FmdB family regulatory protein
MPIYEYICEECNERFDQLRAIPDRDTAECPKCGARATRQLSIFGFGSSGSGGGGCAPTGWGGG